MAETLFNNPWKGTRFDNAIVAAWAKHPSLLPLTALKSAPIGLQTVKVPIRTALTANLKTVGDGNPISYQSSGATSVTITLDKMPAGAELIDDILEYQNEVGRMETDIENKLQACINTLNTSIKTRWQNITVDTVNNIKTTPTAITFSAANVAAEVERLITEASIRLDATIGEGAGNRFVALDSWAYRYLIAGSNKQMEPQVTNGFALVNGLAVPVQGATVYNAGVLPRSYSSSSTETTLEFYVGIPDALAVAVQRQMEIHSLYLPKYAATEVAWWMLYGHADGWSDAIVKCRLVVDGNPLGL